MNSCVGVNDLLLWEFKKDSLSNEKDFSNNKEKEQKHTTEERNRREILLLNMGGKNVGVMSQVYFLPFAWLQSKTKNTKSPLLERLDHWKTAWRLFIL